MPDMNLGRTVYRRRLTEGAKRAAMNSLGWAVMLLLTVSMISWLIWGILPLTALIVYTVAKASLEQSAVSEQRARLIAWLGTLGFWQLAVLAVVACHFLTPLPLLVSLLYGLGSFVGLTLFAKWTGTFVPVDERSADAYCWP